MATYLYKAKKDTAETVTGEIKAQTQDEAIELINQLGLLPISVQPRSGEVETDSSIQHKRIASKERYVFTRQLANLVKSGVTVLRALHIIEEQSQNRTFSKVLNDIAYQVKNGKPLSQALSSYPKIFSRLYVTMVRAGEESGNLQAMLESVAFYQRRQEEIRSKIRTAIAYPILMFVVGLGTVIFMLTYVLPKMTALFESVGEKLPLPTQILLKTSALFSQYGLWAILGVSVFIFLILQWAKSSPGKRVISAFLLSVPFLGEVLLRSELARFCRTLVLLNQGGVSLVNALHIAIPLLENEVVKRDVLKCRENLIAGGSFGETLKRSKKIPSMMGYLIAVGEETGNLDEVLNELAQTYENETNEKIKVMTTLLEPLMILGIGIIIGFIVFAMLLPIFQLDIMSPR